MYKNHLTKVRFISVLLATSAAMLGSVAAVAQTGRVCSVEDIGGYQVVLSVAPPETEQEININLSHAIQTRMTQTYRIIPDGIRRIASDISEKGQEKNITDIRHAVLYVPCNDSEFNPATALFGRGRQDYLESHIIAVSSWHLYDDENQDTADPFKHNMEIGIYVVAEPILHEELEGIAYLLNYLLENADIYSIENVLNSAPQISGILKYGLSLHLINILEHTEYDSEDPVVRDHFEDLAYETYRLLCEAEQELRQGTTSETDERSVGGLESRVGEAIDVIVRSRSHLLLWTQEEEFEFALIEGMKAEGSPSCAVL